MMLSVFIESSGNSCRSLHVPGTTGACASNAWQGGGADYVVSWTMSSLGALEVYALSRITHTFCHRDKERNSFTNYYLLNGVITCLRLLDTDYVYLKMST